MSDAQYRILSDFNDYGIISTKMGKGTEMACRRRGWISPSRTVEGAWILTCCGLNEIGWEAVRRGDMDLRRKAEIINRRDY